MSEDLERAVLAAYIKMMEGIPDEALLLELKRRGWTVQSRLPGVYLLRAPPPPDPPL